MIIGILILVIFSVLILFIRSKMASSSTGSSLLAVSDTYTTIRFIGFFMFLLFFIFLMYMLQNNTKDTKDTKDKKDK